MLLGGASDTWTGVTLATLQNPNFRVAVAGFDVPAGTIFSIDDVLLTVNFTGPPVPAARNWSLTLTALAVILLGMFAVWRVRRQRG